MTIEEQLVAAAETVSWSTQTELVHLENPYARALHVNQFESYDLPGLKRYLLLTSLPYSLYTRCPFALQYLWSRNWCACETDENPHMLKERLFYGTGNVFPDLMVIGDAPSQTGGYGEYWEQGVDVGRIWVGKAASILLRTALQSLNMHHRAWYTNLSKRSIVNNEPTTLTDVDMCSGHLLDEIFRLTPRYILLLGNHVTEQWRKKYYWYHAPVIKIYHPSYYIRMNKTAAEYAEHIHSQVINSGVEM